MTTETKIMLHVRVDSKIKDAAEVALSSMGLTMSEAIRLFLNRVVIEQRLPLDIKVPNAETLAAMKEAELIIRQKSKRFATGEDLINNLEKNS